MCKIFCRKIRLIRGTTLTLMLMYLTDSNFNSLLTASSREFKTHSFCHLASKYKYSIYIFLCTELSGNIASVCFVWESALSTLRMNLSNHNAIKLVITSLLQGIRWKAKFEITLKARCARVGVGAERRGACPRADVCSRIVRRKVIEGKAARTQRHCSW